MASKSYIYGAGLKFQEYLTIPELLDKRAAELGEMPANIFWLTKGQKKDSTSREFSREVITYKDLAEKSFSVASALLDLKLNPGDRIAAMGENCPEWLFLFYACLRIRVLLVKIPANLMYREALIHVLTKYKCRAAFVDSVKLAELIRAEAIKDLDHVGFLQQPEPVINGGALTVQSLIEAPSPGVEAVKQIQMTIDPEDIAVCFPTSGTTGFPKFVTISHFGLVSAGATSIHNMSNHTQSMALLSNRSLAWFGGRIHSSVVFNTRHVICETTCVGNDDILKICAEESASKMFMSPHDIFDAMTAEKEGRCIIPPTLRTVITAGQRINSELSNFLNRTFENALQVYGGTELSIVAEYVINADGSFTSQIVPGVEVKIVDSEGHVLPRGTLGELHVRSPYTTRGYLDEPELTAKVISPSGWLNVGDIGIIKEDGFLEVLDRARDMISRGSTKIHPKTIENVIQELPTVKAVSAIGIPDAKWFEEICVVVIPVEGASISDEELRAFCRDNFIGNDQLVPRYYLVLEKFPFGTTGKIDRDKLVQLTQAKYNLI